MLEDMNAKARENGKKMDSSDGIGAEMHGSLDGVSAKRENTKHSNGIEYTFENGKCRNEMSQFDKNEVDNDGKEGKEDEEKTRFLCNFVWGKIKDNPWWPGQIYDPSNASDYAKKLQKRDKLLVAFFGDGTFSWCSKSQLKPFLDNFNNMSKQNNFKKLKHAIEEALDEIGRIVDCKMGNRRAFDRPLVVNAGIRQGVLVPEYDISEVPCFDPVKIISLVKNAAKNPFVFCMLELAVLKSLLSAFNRSKRKNEPTMFPMYHKKMQTKLASLSTKIGGGKSELVSDKENIESITEKVDKITTEETEKIDASMVKRVTRSSNRDSTGKGVYQVREDLASPLESTTKKRKMNEMFDEMMEKKGNAENGSKKKATRLKNEERKENQNVPAKDNEFGTEKVDKTTQRGTENVAVSSNKELGTEKLDKFTKRGNEKIAVSKDKESGTDKADKITKTGTENLGPNHRDEKLSSLSQITRKRKNNDSSEFPEIKDEKKSAKMASNDKVFDDQDTQMGERLNKVAGQVIGSVLSLDSSNKPSQNENCKEIDTSNETSPKEGKEINEPFLDNISKEVVISMKAPLKEEGKTIDSVRINLSMQKVVLEIRSAALNPLVLGNKNFLETVEGFFAYRNVEYVFGSNYKINNNVGKKCNSVKNGSKFVKANDKNIGEKASKPVSLLVIFPPGFCLPSKTDLIKIFSEFGGLNEMETDVLDDCYCGKIVFLSYSDTEKAFNTCLQKSPFGSAKVSYQLQGELSAPILYRFYKKK